MMTQGHLHFGTRMLLTSGLMLGAIALGADPLQAQLTPDATLGAESSIVGPPQVIQGLPSNVISGGAVRGVNLFHSFQDFNVGAAQGVFFANPANVQNIFTRVTGGNPSTILGTLGVLGGANLFLLNPSGIVFGPGASLSIQGSFVASTASAIQLGNGEVFSAIAPQAPPLITVQPNATFLNALSAITNQGTLQTGQNLTLQATTVTNTGTLQAGQNLDVQATTVTNTGTLQAGQNLDLQGTQIDSSGSLLAPNGSLTATAISGDITASQLTAQTASLTASNAIALPASQVAVTGDLALNSNTVQITDSVAAPGNLTVGGNLAIASQTLILDTANNPGSTFQVAGSLTATANGGTLSSRGTFAIGGDAVLQATNLAIANSQFTITGNATLQGNSTTLTSSQLSVGGNLVLGAQTPLVIQDAPGFPTGLTVGGDAVLQGWQGVALQFTDPASAVQTTGNLAISSNGAISLQGTLTSTGNLAIAAGGNLQVADSQMTSTTGSLSLTASGDSTLDRSQFQAATDLNLTAQGGLQMRDRGDRPFIASAGGNLTLQGNAGIDIQAQTNAASRLQTGGNLAMTSPAGSVNSAIAMDVAGQLAIVANTNIILGDYTGNGVQLTALNGLVSVGTLNLSSSTGTGGAAILTGAQGVTATAINTASTAPTGNGGEVRLTSDRGNITVGPITTTSLNTNGGNVMGFAAGTLTVGPITTSANGAGLGGSVNLTGRLGLATVAAINTSSVAGSAGNIALISPTGSLDTTATALIANTGSTGGNGGSVGLQSAGDLAVGNIQTTGGTQGGGGRIDLTAPGTIAIAPNQVIDSTTRGNGSGGDVNLSGQSVVVQTGAQVNTGTQAAGNGGNINVQAAPTGSLRFDPGSMLSAAAQGNTASGSAGTIRLTGGTLALTGATLESTVTSGDGVGGTVSLMATNGNIALTNSRISTDTVGSGAAGPVTLSATGAITSINSTLSAQTQGDAIAGTLTLLAPSITALNSTFDVAALGRGRTGTLAIATVNDGDVYLSGRIVATAAANTGNGGTVMIQGNNVTLNNLVVDATNRSAVDGSKLAIAARNQLAIENGSAVLTQVAPNATGRGGNIILSGAAIALSGASQVDASTRGLGTGGNIQLTAPTIQLSQRSQINATTTASGSAGTIDIQAGTLQVVQASQISAAVVGGTGRGGDIRIGVNRLDLSTGGQIMSSTSGSGPAGSINVVANQTITIAGGGSQASGLFAQSSGGGPAGDLAIATSTLTLFNGGEISASSTGTGNAGRIQIGVNRLNLSNGGKITSRNTGAGNAGTIAINVRDRLRMSAGEIAASAEQGGGGQITISARDILLTRGSLISSSVSDGTGGGGNITIRARNSFFAFDDSDILANAQFGDGGTIMIDSPLFIADLFATVGRNPGRDFSRFRGNGRVDISSASGFGVSGTVNIPDTSFIQNSLTPLDAEFVSSEQLVAGSCLARRSIGRSSFVVKGTGGLARTPYGQAVSRYVVVPVEPVPAAAVPKAIAIAPVSQPAQPYLSWQPGDPIQEAQGLIRTPDGRVVLGTMPQLVSVVNAQDLVCGF